MWRQKRCLTSFRVGRYWWQTNESVFVPVRPAGWRSDRHQHSQSHGRNLFCHPLRQDQAVPGRVTWQTGQRLKCVTHYYNMTFYITVNIRHRDRGGQRALKVSSVSCNHGAYIYIYIANLWYENKSKQFQNITYECLMSEKACYCWFKVRCWQDLHIIPDFIS